MARLRSYSQGASHSRMKKLQKSKDATDVKEEKIFSTESSTAGTKVRATVGTRQIAVARVHPELSGWHHDGSRQGVNAELSEKK